MVSSSKDMFETPKSELGKSPRLGIMHFGVTRITTSGMTVELVNVVEVVGLGKAMAKANFSGSHDPSRP